MEIFSLAGKRALVAGASRGIGLAIAQSVAEAGAETILAARSVDAIEKASAVLRDRGLKASALKVDIASKQSVAEAAGAAGDIDILINVAGTNVRKPFAEYTDEEDARLWETNLHGIVRLTRKIGARMVKRGTGGKIINIGSLASMLGLPYLTVYAMTKSALAGLTRALAAEWGRHNIQVNAICPGFIITDLNRAMWQPPEMMEWLRGGQAMPRSGTPEDIAPLAVFLASRGADYITGQLISVDGGFTTTAVWPFEPK